MKNVQISFKFNDANDVPIVHKKIPGRLIFDVKMISLVRKSRYIAGDPRTNPPKNSVYSSVVSCNSVCIWFLLTAINDVDILAADIQNAYLEASTIE